MIAVILLIAVALACFKRLRDPFFWFWWQTGLVQPSGAQIIANWDEHIWDGGGDYLVFDASPQDLTKWLSQEVHGQSWQDGKRAEKTFTRRFNNPLLFPSDLNSINYAEWRIKDKNYGKYVFVALDVDRGRVWFAHVDYTK